MIFKWQEQPWKAWTRLRERLPHAILIQSGEGMGEFEFAQACAQSLLCERPQPDQRACGACHACNWFSLGNHPDFRLIVPESMAPESREEGAEPSKRRSEQIRIEQARELADFLAVGTHRGGLRVILIYPAEAMNAKRVAEKPRRAPARHSFPSRHHPARALARDGAKPLPEVRVAVPALRSGPALAEGAGLEATRGDTGRRWRCAASRAQSRRHGRGSPALHRESWKSGLRSDCARRNGSARSAVGLGWMAAALELRSAARPSRRPRTV